MTYLKSEFLEWKEMYTEAAESGPAWDMFNHYLQHIWDANKIPAPLSIWSQWMQRTHRKIIRNDVPGRRVFYQGIRLKEIPI